MLLKLVLPRMTAQLVIRLTTDEEMDVIAVTIAVVAARSRLLPAVKTIVKTITLTGMSAGRSARVTMPNQATGFLQMIETVVARTVTLTEEIDHRRRRGALVVWGPLAETTTQKLFILKAT